MVEIEIRKKGSCVQEFKKEIALAWVTGISLIFPLFFQLSGHIYNSAEAIVDSGGVLKTLPLPVSVLSCFGGILMLASRYRRALPALATLGGMFAAMGISLLLAGNELDIEWRKILLMAQVMLPTFGLALGQMTADEDKIIPLDTRIALTAADLSMHHKLAMADAVIYASALLSGAKLFTSDPHFSELSEVCFWQKT